MANMFLFYCFIGFFFLILWKDIRLMKSQQETCKNCERRFNSNFKFCPFCGQESKEELTVKVLFYNTIRNYFSVDARFFKSFLPLLFKPGYLAIKFVEGKRLLYLHPAQMYLFISVVFFFLFSFVQRQQVQSLDENLAKILSPSDRRVLVEDSLSVLSVPDKNEVASKKHQDSMIRAKVLREVTENQLDSLNETQNLDNENLFGFKREVLDSLITIGAPNTEIYKAMGMPADARVFKTRLYSQALKFYKSKRGGSILQTFYDTIPIAMFFLLPIFALILMVFYRKYGYYAHHLVFSFYYFALIFTVFSIILVLNFIYDIPGWGDFIFMLSVYIYLLVGLKRFYRQGWLKSFFKTSLVTILFLCFVAPLAVGLLGVFAFLFY